ncbi:hypothetical protein ACHAWF_014913 [Thalassiosira exigua]
MAIAPSAILRRALPRSISSSRAESRRASATAVAAFRHPAPPTPAPSSSLVGVGPTPARAFSSEAFDPPPPNQYHGAPVYDDVLLTSGPSEAAVARNADSDAVFVVTGASRSMGLQFVRELLVRTEGRVVACARRIPDDDGGAPELGAWLSGLSEADRSRVEVQRLDVTDSDQIDALARYLEDAHGRVDGLFNVAGVLGEKGKTPGPEMNLSQFDPVWAADQMAVNAIGPLALSSRLAPLLKARKGRSKYLRETGARESIVVNLSARVASADDNQGGLAWYTYRMSKAALNQGVRTSSHELRRQGTWTVALYPGMTDTDMSQPFQTKAMRDKCMVFPVEFTVRRLMDVVDRTEEGHSGGFYDWAGQAIPF